MLTTVNNLEMYENVEESTLVGSISKLSGFVV